MNKLERVLENLIFASRWIQAPVYLGLALGALLYSYKFVIELIHLFAAVNEFSEEHIMLGVLSLVDITMVLNLLVMVIIGGYATFVSRISVENHEDRPDWLEKIDAGVMKVKLASSLVGVSGIHLLKTFMNIDNKDWQHVMWQVIIHCVFLLSTLMLASSERILHFKHRNHK